MTTFSHMNDIYIYIIQSSHSYGLYVFHELVIIAFSLKSDINFLHSMNDIKLLHSLIFIEYKN